VRSSALARAISAPAVVITAAVLAVTSGAPPAANTDRQTPRSVSYELGEDLFFHETFGGNGRTCATCHDPRNEFTMSPALVEQRFQLDPSHPLFRAIDSDDGAGRDYTTLRAHALFRVTIPLAPNVSLADAPKRRTITVWRAVPTIVNVDLTAPYLADGRSPTLQDQAAGAIRDHMQATHAPQARELDALRAFGAEVYYPQRIRALEDASDPVPKEPGFSVPVQSSAAQRGKLQFDLHCRSCHDGELADSPTDPSRSRFQNVFVSEANRSNLPLLRLAFRRPDGVVQIVETPDPGRAALTGDLLDLNAFDTPALRGVKHTAPYFHDNSLPTLRDVVDHYNSRFQFHMTSQQADDLVSYLELF
jgi:cytochrome c peroxidase